MKKAIVAGANGFVGSAVATHLQSQGIEVVALSRSVKAFKTRDYPFLVYDKCNPTKIESDLHNLNWDADASTVFFNFSWGGKETLTDGMSRCIEKLIQKTSIKTPRIYCASRQIIHDPFRIYGEILY